MAQNDEADAALFGRIERVFASARAGKMLKDALAEEALTPSWFWHRLESDRHLRARWSDAKAKMVAVRGGDPSEEAFAAARQRLRDEAAPGVQAARDRFDEVEKLLRTGASVRRVCIILGIHRAHLKRAVRDTALRSRYQAALKAGKPSRTDFYAANVRPLRARSYSAQRGRLRHVGDVMGLIDLGWSLEAACRARSEFPSPTQVSNAMRRDPALRLRFQKSSRHLRKRPAESLSDETLQNIIQALSTGTLLKDACSRHGILVPAFRYRLRESAWRRRWMDAKTQLLRERNLVTLELAAAPTALGNEVWRRIRAVLPAWLDAAKRDEVTSDMVLAILEGSLSVQSISRESAVEFIRAHRVDNSPYRFASLDKPVGSDSKATLIDFIGAEW